MLQQIGSIGWAVQRMKEGAKLTRKAWGNDNVFTYYIPSAKYPASGNTLGTMAGRYEDDLVPYQAYIAIKQKDDTVVPYVFGTDSILADDWEEVV